jgi:hypothetical protein
MSAAIADVISFLPADEKTPVDVIFCSQPVAMRCALAHSAFPDQGIWVIRLAFVYMKGNRHESPLNAGTPGIADCRRAHFDDAQVAELYRRGLSDRDRHSRIG